MIGVVVVIALLKSAVLVEACVVVVLVQTRWSSVVAFVVVSGVVVTVGAVEPVVLKVG